MDHFLTVTWSKNDPPERFKLDMIIPENQMDIIQDIQHDI